MNPRPVHAMVVEDEDEIEETIDPTAQDQADQEIDAEADSEDEDELESDDIEDDGAEDEIAADADGDEEDDADADEASPENVTRLFPETIAPPQSAQLRMVEAILFAAAEPLDEASIVERMPPDCDVPALLAELAEIYSKRGVNLVRVAARWAFRTAPDLAKLLEKHATEQRRLSRAAMETLAIVAYHQPVTRAEIEEIRGVTVSKGSLDLLLEVGWIKMRGRRRVPGRPVTYGTTEAFLTHFGLDKVSDLPGLEELKAAGVIEGRTPAAFVIPNPSDALAPDEDPLEDGDQEDLPLAPTE